MDEFEIWLSGAVVLVALLGAAFVIASFMAYTKESIAMTILTIGAIIIPYIFGRMVLNARKQLEPWLDRFW